MALKDDLANAIDTTWHHSQHWETDEHGSLTTKGLQDAAESCSGQMKDCINRLWGLQGASEKITEELAFRADVHFEEGEILGCGCNRICQGHPGEA